MCEAEEVLNWLLEEIEQKSKDVTACGDDLYWAVELGRATGDAMGQLDELMVEFKELAREAKQRLKEARQQVAA